MKSSSINKLFDLEYELWEKMIPYIISKVSYISDGDKQFNFSNNELLKTCIEIQDHYKNSYTLNEPMISAPINNQNIDTLKVNSKLSKINELKQINFTDKSNIQSNIISFFKIHLGIPDSVHLLNQNLDIVSSNEIFQEISINYIVPILSDWFKNLVYSQIGIQEFTNILLHFCGLARNTIAVINNDDAKEYMGKSAMSCNLFDNLNNLRWKSWFNTVSNEICKAFTEKSNTLDLDIDRKKIYMIEKCKESNNFGRYHHPEDFTAKNEGQTHSASYNFGYHYGETRNMVIDSITCVHLKNIESKTFNIGKEIYKTITKTEITVPELKDDLLSILWEMTHSTLYQRGQAAIIKFILCAVTNTFNLVMKFSEEWSFPNMNYDQQGLVELNKEKFVTKDNHQYIELYFTEEIFLSGEQH